MLRVVRSRALAGSKNANEQTKAERPVPKRVVIHARVCRKAKSGGPCTRAYRRVGSVQANLEPPGCIQGRSQVSDLRHFIAWCEATWNEGNETSSGFLPTSLSTPLLTQYRAYLQVVLHLRPTGVEPLADQPQTLLCVGSGGRAALTQSCKSRQAGSRGKTRSASPG
jgi:hypothetical protein